MKTDRASVESMLHKFSFTLVHQPRWIGLLSKKGELLASIEKDDHAAYPKFDEEAFVKQLFPFIESQFDLMDNSLHHNTIYSVIQGAGGTLIYFNMNDQFSLILSFRGTYRFSSIDEMMEDISLHWTLIINAIYELD
jgi:hypothetical protein